MFNIVVFFLDASLTFRDPNLGHGTFNPHCGMDGPYFSIGIYTFVPGSGSSYPRTSTFANVSYSCYNDTGDKVTI